MHTQNNGEICNNNYICLRNLKRSRVVLVECPRFLNFNSKTGSNFYDSYPALKADINEQKNTYTEDGHM
jgi:hypothetical protein